MRRVLPPRPGGVAAALTAAPHADVVFVAHTGLEHLSTVRDLWRGLPMDKTLHLRWWFVPAAEVPRGGAGADRLALPVVGDDRRLDHHHVGRVAAGRRAPDRRARLGQDARGRPSSGTTDSATPSASR